MEITLNRFHIYGKTEPQPCWLQQKVEIKPSLRMADCFIWFLMTKHPEIRRSAALRTTEGNIKWKPLKEWRMKMHEERWEAKQRVSNPKMIKVCPRGTHFQKCPLQSHPSPASSGVCRDAPITWLGYRFSPVSDVPAPLSALSPASLPLQRWRKGSFTELQIHFSWAGK